jgi:HSP20 family molecular chaperone IbpA
MHPAQTSLPKQEALTTDQKRPPISATEFNNASVVSIYFFSKDKGEYKSSYLQSLFFFCRMRWRCRVHAVQAGGYKRMTLFSSPLFLGFDHFERLVDRASKIASEGYPPYNIEQAEEGGLKITLAVAGFFAEDIEVFIDDNQLIIQGQHAEQEDRVYLHKGIATRQFRRTFILAEGMKVLEASFENGLLHIALMRPKIESKAHRIPIRTSSHAPATPKLLDNKPIGEKGVPHELLSPCEDSDSDLT